MKVKKSSIYYTVLLILIFIVQCSIRFTISNIISALICVITSWIAILYLKKIWKRGYFLSSIPILGGVVGTQFGPLFFQTLSLNSVDFNLRLPILTFLYTGIFLLTLIIGHFLYTNSIYTNRIKSTIQNGYNRLGLYEDMPIAVAIGLTGLSFYSIYFKVTNDVQIGDAGGKFLEIFMVFTVIPLAYFVQQIQNKKSSQTKNFIILGIYFILLVALGLFKNSRGTFATFALSSIIFIIYFFYTNRLIFTKKIFYITCIVIFPLILFFKLLTVVSGAIILARGERKDINGMEFLKISYEYFKDIYLGNIDEYGVNVNVVENMDSYNELYLYNDFLSRLIRVKFSDNILYYSSFLSINDYYKVNVFYIEKSIALLPQQILDIINLGYQKSNYLFYSYGDWIYSLSQGGGLGGFKVGSIVGSGINLFGIWFFIITIIISPYFFAFIDSLNKNNKTQDGDSKNTVISVMGVLVFYKLFLLANSDSIMTLISFLLREFWQTLLIYILFLNSYKFFKKIIRIN